MATLSSHELYIVITYISYSGITGDMDRLYTDKAEAEKVASMMSQPDPKFPSMKPLKYSVMTLDDFVDELKSEARDEGRRSERDRD